MNTEKNSCTVNGMLKQARIVPRLLEQVDLTNRVLNIVPLGGNFTFRKKDMSLKPNYSKLCDQKKKLPCLQTAVQRWQNEF